MWHPTLRTPPPLANRTPRGVQNFLIKSPTRAEIAHLKHQNHIIYQWLEKHNLITGTALTPEGLLLQKQFQNREKGLTA